ncbi:MAG: DNA-binding transcriptional activator PspC [Hyphococcus sp.]|nr:MAG: DNA-binding transcriptional activator PspC [Marinicaulis sp.]
MRERHHHYHHHHWREKDGYAHRAGDPGPGPNHHRLYKDKNNAMIAGVCAGIANYYGWRPDGIRVGFVILSLFVFPLPLIAYMVAAFILKPTPSAPVYETREEERFWRTFSTRPKATFSELKHRFRALDARIIDLESAVMSDEYGLRKAFRDLERGA